MKESQIERDKGNKHSSSDVASLADGSSGVVHYEDAERLSTLLADLIALNGSKRPNVTKSWLSAIDRMIRLDGRTPEQIERAIRWCQQDEFWRANVLSAPTLRRQFDRLRLAAKRKPQGSKVSKNFDTIDETAARFAGGD